MVGDGSIVGREVGVDASVVTNDIVEVDWGMDGSASALVAGETVAEPQPAAKTNIKSNRL